MDKIEQFLSEHQDAQGNLSDEDMAKLLTGGHAGDTTAAKSVDTGEPNAGDEAKDSAQTADAKAAPEPKQSDKPADDKSEPEPIVLAKDGKHTIPYQKLLDAREEARAAKAEADELRARVAKGSAPTDEQAAAAAADPSVKTLVAEAINEARTADAAQAAHFRTIHAKYPDAESIVESTEYLQWLSKQPTFVRNAYESVAQSGTAAQVVEMLDAYRSANPLTPAPAVPSTQQKVEEIVAGVKSKAPLSLSDIPAGSSVHHDEAEAMSEMSAADLMGKFEGKSPAQLEALMRRLV